MAATSVSVVGVKSMPAKPGPAVTRFQQAGHMSAMMSNFAVWRKSGLFADLTFHCTDGKVLAHRLVLAAASKLMAAILSNKDEKDESEVVIVPGVSSAELTALLDIIYKGQMMITPTSTWAVKSLVQTLEIKATNVSVLSNVKFPLEDKTGAALNSSPSTSSAPLKRKRRSSKLGVSKKQKLSPPKQTIIKKSSDMLLPPVAPVQIAPPLPVSGELPSTGFHDMENVETWVCAICGCYDPILSSPLKAAIPEAGATTDWIGCDCNRWFHTQCTKLKKISDNFSCKQLKMQCIVPVRRVAKSKSKGKK